MEKEHTRHETRKVCKVFPWFLCALSFTVQFIGMGFYRGFGSIYVALQNEFNENDAVLGMVAAMLLYINCSLYITLFLIITLYKFCNLPLSGCVVPHLVTKQTMEQRLSNFVLSFLGLPLS